MNHQRNHRHDVAHHHPHVHRGTAGSWSWNCSCGGASTRTALVAFTWREAVIAALNHSGSLAA